MTTTDNQQIEAALGRLFHAEGHRIVFWNDPQREFQNVVSFLNLPDIKILRLDQVGALEAKIRLERQDPTGRYLVYSPTEEPDYEADWLLDVRLYSRSFRADRASIILMELGLSNLHLRQHIQDRRKFFDNRDRTRKLQALVAPDDTAADLDLKMLAVTCQADQPELFNIVRTLFHSYAEADASEGPDLDAPPPCWKDIEKFDLAEPFWQKVHASFAYSEEIPTLRNLLVRLFLADYAHHLRGPLPPPLQHLLLPRSGLPNAVVCLAQWRDGTSKGQSYDLLSSACAAILKIEDHLHGLEIASVLDVMTFLEVEKKIVRDLRDRVMSSAGAILNDEVRTLASRRQAGHWASLTVPESRDVPRQALHGVYDALVAAADFFALRNLHRDGFEFAGPKEMYQAYVTELYRFDQLYRHFCEAADQAEAKGWGLLKSLRQEVEACYTNWYVVTMSLAWGRFVGPRGVAGEPALLNKWRIDEVPNQQSFFQNYVRPRLDEGESRKAYVIVSDAFRYEAAQELARELNGKYRFQAELSSQLGVLPSYTALGMASLLPHQVLAFKSNGEVLVDGMLTSSLAQRDEILQKEGGIACRADDLLAKKKEEGRELVSSKRVIYVYHNVVDAIGDASSTEKDTFAAVRKAIGELADLVGHIINNLNGSHVLITADHGFLFAETAPGEPDKSKIPEKPPGTVKAKKRYLLGHGLPDHESVWHGDTATTAQAEGGMEFWIPRGANRFHFVGGARFIHGGAMLQEIVVPVITVRHVRGKSAKETKTRQVTVHVLGASHKITAPTHRFELLQTEPVSERIKAITLKVAVYEGDEPVTDIASVTFDSASTSMDERKKWVRLVLQERKYDKKIPYHLVLRDAYGDEHQRADVMIDRAFADDF